jgi:hypothetical protein
MLERKVVNCAGLKLEKSVRAKCSVKPEKNNQLMKHRVAVNKKINLRKYSEEVRRIGLKY